MRRAHAVEAPLTAPVTVAVSPSFGAMLKRYRRAAGLTQEALAERAGYSVGHISKLESSVRQPVPATVELLADALELEPAERSAFGRAARRIGALPYDPPRAHVQALPPLIDRSREQACIERYLVSEAEPPLLLFAGEPGIGKSRLLREAADRGMCAGWFVLEGVCRRHGAQGPYGPLLEAFSGALHQMEPGQLRTAIDGCSWLVRLLPELAEMRVAPMPAWSLPADQERRLMFSAVERFLGNIAGPAGTLLVLDNLQWAEAGTLDLLSALIEAAPQSQLRIIAAYRHTEVRPVSPLATLLTDLAREGLVIRETVGALAPSAAAELLNTLLAVEKHVDAETRVAVLRKAAGVPFVLVSYAQWLRSKASQEGSGTSDLGIPWDVTQAIQERIAALPEAAQEVVRIAAVSDGDDARELLTKVAGQLGYDELDVAQAIDAACEAGLLVHRGGDMYAFAYDLTQEVVERTLGPAQRAYLHREIAKALGDGRTHPSVEAMANHYVQAGELEKALVYLERAGTKAKALHAYADAEHYYRSLAERLEERGQTRDVARAREHLGTMLGFMGRYEEALEELERALEGYRAGGWRDGQARAAAQIGRVYYALGDIEQGIARMEQEIIAAVGSSDRSMAALYISLAQLYNEGGLHRRELDSIEHAASLAHASDDRHLLALVELERGTTLGVLDRLDDGQRVLEDIAVPLTEATGDLWTQVLALDRAATSHILRGEFREARADIERGMVVGWQLDDQLVSGLMTLNRGILCFYTGVWQQARADLRWASAMLRPRQAPARAALAAVWRGRLSLTQGRWERADFQLRRGLTLTEQRGDAQPAILAHCALAERELMERKPDEARIRLEALLAGDEYRMSDVTEALALLGWAHLELGDERQGEALVAASVMRASATGLQGVLADALRIQALVATHEGRWQDAQVSLAEALSLARALPYPYAEAKALYVSGQLLIQRGDSQRGREQLATARAILSQLGEHLYAQSVDQLSVIVTQAGAEHR